MENAWAFYRRSTDRQELSIDDQRRECRAFAAARGWHIVREFEPRKGFGSGLTIDRDPAFQEMVALAELGGHGVRHLVVYDVSRFGRLQQEDKIYWERRFKKQGGIDIVYVKDEFKNDGSISDTLLKVVKHSEAHQFSLKLSEVTLRGAKSHAALGHSAGGAAPFGYDRLEIDPAGQPVRVMNTSNDWKSNKLHRVIWTPSPINAPVVRSVFETYEQGTGLNLIVQQLNQRKISAPRGEHWSKTMVHYMLRNRAYIGERSYNRRSFKAYRRGERASLANPSDAWIIKEGAHEAIVDRELFERVQMRMKTRVVGIGRTFHRPYLLTGIARCARCGYRMIGQPVAGNGHRYLMYTCSGYLRIGKSVCRSVHILASALEAEVLSSIRQHLASPEWKSEVRDTLERMVDQEFGENAQSRVQELQRRLDELNRQISNLVGAIKTSGRFSEAMNQALADLEAQRNSMLEHLKDAARRANHRVGAEALAANIMAYFGDFDRLWREGLTLEEQKELLRCYVHQINVNHAADAVSADIWLYRIPVSTTQMTPALSGLEPIVTRVNCGGRHLTLVKGVTPEILPLVVRRQAALKKPYLHYRASVA
jgi:DNA invertase Pin-like site-specific DNA recombinase/DNA-binding transcriptional MerR regulator